MSENLFANVEGNKVSKIESSAYSGVIEQRERPAMPVNPNEVKITKDESKSALKKQIKKLSLVEYEEEDVLKKATAYFKGDELAASVWMKKYALKDSAGNIYEQTPDEMHHRLASEIARIEQKYPNPMSEADIYALLKDFKYIVPQGGPMSGIGNDYQNSSLSNCFVVGNQGSSDSYGGIMKIDQEQVQLMKRRGGVGHDLSHIRPKGSPVKNSALT
jgi:ribonucleoside-diphosphate reductase alpha chain